ncbi:hypothetical protein HJFPF1_04000 [Paramyrothecium foliicola]|nr:hypothetical protein HJFPF1_04000 [Paramyrothecium foliicola]
MPSPAWSMSVRLNLSLGHTRAGHRRTRPTLYLERANPQVLLGTRWNANFLSATVQDCSIITMESRTSLEKQHPPPPYNGSASEGNNSDPAPPSYTALPPATASTSASTPAPAPAPSQPSAVASSSSSSQSFLASAKEAYKARRAAKDLDRKVEFYEKLYGFVPKNVMSEAEWKAAKSAAPKVKKKGQLKSTTYMMHG